MLRGGVSQGGRLKVIADKKGVVGILPLDKTALICGGQMEEGGVPSPEGTPPRRIRRALLMLCCLSVVLLCRNSVFPTPSFPSSFSLSTCWELLQSPALLLPDSTQRSQDELLSVTHTPLCHGAAWGPGHLFPRPARKLEGEASSPAEVYDDAPILSGAPLNLLPGGIQTK